MGGVGGGESLESLRMLQPNPVPPIGIEKMTR